jgi:hypothetical protein
VSAVFQNSPVDHCQTPLASGIHKYNIDCVLPF